MTKATVTIIRQIKTSKPLGTKALTITEAMVSFTATGQTIHAEQVRLRRMTSMVLFPVSTGGSGVNVACATKLNPKRMNNYASIGIKHLGTLATGDGSMKILTGGAQDYYGIFLGD